MFHKNVHNLVSCRLNTKPGWSMYIWRIKVGMLITQGLIAWERLRGFCAQLRFKLGIMSSSIKLELDKQNSISVCILVPIIMFVDVFACTSIFVYASIGHVSMRIDLPTSEPPFASSPPQLSALCHLNFTKKVRNSTWQAMEIEWAPLILSWSHRKSVCCYLASWSGKGSQWARHPRPLAIQLSLFLIDS